jgi:hypothetical protein
MKNFNFITSIILVLTLTCSLGFESYSQDIHSLAINSYNTSYNKGEGLFIGFDLVKVMQVNPIDNEMIDEWEKNTSIVFFTNANKTKITCKEYNFDEELIKEYTHNIIHYSQDKSTHIFTVIDDNSGEVYRTIFWKDLSMVVLENKAEVYIITGKYQLKKH